MARTMPEGHSRKSAPRGLAISPETVTLHDKHIYENSELASRAEHFSRFLGALARAEATPLDDPLAAYLATPGPAVA